jgi:hypothetical protein
MSSHIAAIRHPMAGKPFCVNVILIEDEDEDDEDE